MLRQRSDRLRPVFAELLACEAAGRLSVPRAQLAASYLHMHANRLLRSSQRQQELVLYDFLLREYESRIAQAVDEAARITAEDSLTAPARRTYR